MTTTAAAFDPYDYRHLRGIAQPPDVTIMNLRRMLSEAREENKVLQVEVDRLRALEWHLDARNEDCEHERQEV